MDKRLVLVLSVIAALFSTVQGHGNDRDETETYKEQQLSIGKVDVQWKYDKESDMLYFKVVGPTTGWLAFGFSYKKMKMEDYDIALGGVRNNNESYLYDLYSTTKSKPPLDVQQNFNLTKATEIGGKTTLEFYRKRQTGDVKDLQFESGKPVYFMWAFHPTKDATDGNTFDYHVTNRAHTESTYDVLSKSGGCALGAGFGAVLAVLLVHFNL